MQVANAAVHVRGDWSRSGLDLMRFTLALVVVLGHVTRPMFQSAWPDLTPHAHMAVGGFFVLSGYTIRAVTSRSKRFDASGFFADRASRLWSVSILALFVTIFADSISSKLAPSFYVANFSDSIDMPYIRMLVNLFMVSQVWGLDVSPLSNSPFWSLSYEAGFYAIWAAYLYWVRERGSIFWLVLVLGCLGPNIVVMLPFWLLGALLFDIGRLGPKRRNAIAASIVVVCMLVLGAVLVRHAGTLQVLKSLVPATQSFIDALFAHLHIDVSRVAVSVMAGALASFFILVPGLTLADWLTKVAPFPALASRLLATLGELTFPLYLLHFPILVLARAGNWYNPASNRDKALLVLAILMVAYLSTKFTEPFKLWMRSSLRSTLQVGRVLAVDGSRRL